MTTRQCNYTAAYTLKDRILMFTSNSANKTTKNTETKQIVCNRAQSPESGLSRCGGCVE